jgi:monovalent cation:H+ antiporter-2, CPA2 family
MPHDTPLVSTIVAGLVLAFIFGTVANRLRMPPLVGYLAAGIAVGPFTPGFVADTDLATQLSEIGVILLMFGVGLHFSLKDLLSVRALAIPGAIVQIGGATLLGLALATSMGWSLGAGLIFGLALSVASTVVLLKALQERHMVESEKGRIAVGWLIVEDLAMVLALVLIPAIASIFGVAGAEIHDPFVDFVERLVGPLGLFGVLAVTLVKLAAFVGFMLVVGRRLIPGLLHYTAHTGSRELFRLAVLAIALGVAAGSAYLFGVSLALGAFFAGMILSESELSHRAAQETLPLRDAFSVLFFVAVGMLFNPMILIEDPLPVIATVLIIVVGKSLFAFGIVIAFRRSVSTALTISASLAQIGEFSFILAALGVGLGILPPEGRNLILAGAIISIVLNPVVFWGLDRLRPTIEAWLGRHARAETEPRREPDLVSPQPAPALANAEPEEADAPALVPTSKTGHVVLVGYGRVGAVVGAALKAANRAFLVIEDGEDAGLAARATGAEVIAGNAASPDVLACANLEGAVALVVGIPNSFEAGQATEQARRLNKSLLIVARAHSDGEESYLRSLGANIIIMGEREIGLGMAEIITRDSRAVAEIVAADAVEQALAPLAGVGAVAAVTPAVPMAPFAEMPSAIAEPLDVDPEPDEVAASSVPEADNAEAEPAVVEPSVEESATPSRPRRMPSSTPGEAFATQPESFNPEVPPR